jgi:TetR/AcrR family transcriptional repressor of multidrug resistance operon
MGVNMALEKPELIMAHAEQLFISHGFHGTSMQMIAKAAGIAAGTVYLGAFPFTCWSMNYN